MTQRSQAERSKAFRIRRKGASAKPEEIAWLADYDADSPVSIPKPVAEDAVIVSETPRPVAAPAVAPVLPEGHVTLDFGAVADPVSHPAPEACTIPNCPKCKSRSGAIGTCGTTGETVWPPIQPESAEAMAATLMGGIAFIARVMRKDKQLILPTEAERKMMGKALQTTLNRRFNQAGAVDDIFFLLFALVSYGQRAFTADAPVKELAPNAPR